MVAEDRVFNATGKLPYRTLCNPVFRLSVLGASTIFMVDTGATVNLGFPTLQEKFPHLQPLPTDATVNGVGGLATIITGKFFLTVNIGGRSTTLTLLLSDHPISNLDGLIGMEALKSFNSWSLGGDPTAGAYLELNGVRLKLIGFGTPGGSTGAIHWATGSRPRQREETLGTLSWECDGTCSGETCTQYVWEPMVPHREDLSSGSPGDHPIALGQTGPDTLGRGSHSSTNPPGHPKATLNPIAQGGAASLSLEDGSPPPRPTVSRVAAGRLDPLGGDQPGSLHPVSQSLATPITPSRPIVRRSTGGNPDTLGRSSHSSARPRSQSLATTSTPGGEGSTSKALEDDPSPSRPLARRSTDENPDTLGGNHPGFPRPTSQESAHSRTRDTGRSVSLTIEGVPPRTPSTLDHSEATQADPLGGCYISSASPHDLLQGTQQARETQGAGTSPQGSNSPHTAPSVSEAGTTTSGPDGSLGPMETTSEPNPVGDPILTPQREQSNLGPDHPDPPPAPRQGVDFQSTCTLGMPSCLLAVGSSHPANDTTFPTAQLIGWKEGTDLGTPAPEATHLPEEDFPPGGGRHPRRRRDSGARPSYSAVFINSRWQPSLLGEYDVPDLEGHRVYAMEDGAVPARRQGRIPIQVEGRTQGSSYLFAPFFAPDQWDLVTIEGQSPTAGRIALVNYTSREISWERGDFLGRIQTPEEVFTPHHGCDGDPTWGREQDAWYDTHGPGDLLTSLVSVNQQTHVYQDADGVWRGGPGPGLPRVGQVNLCHGQGHPRGGELHRVAGSFRDRDRFGSQDVIVHQVNGSEVTSSGLSQILERHYPYGSIYRRKTSKYPLLGPQELRPLGSCLLKTGEGPDHPGIASLVGQFFYGEAIDQGGSQDSYRGKFPDRCSPPILQRLEEDTRANRLEWFRQALAELATTLKGDPSVSKSPIQRVFFPHYIGCTGNQVNHDSYLAEVEAFTKALHDQDQTQGIVVYLVIDPQENRERLKGRYPTIPAAQPHTFRHLAGLYQDPQTTFCQDPACTHCPANKKVLEVLREEAGTDVPQPMSDIMDGMSPDAHIPRAPSEEERKELFEQLLPGIKIGELGPERTGRVQALLRKHSKVFITSDNEPAGQIRGLEVDIPTTGPAICTKRRQFNQKAVDIMERLNATMMRKGLTRPCDGPWSSPVVLVKKKAVPGQDPQSAKSYRFCVDYRRINSEAIIWTAYPTADMRAQLHRACGFEYYSAVDVNAAFHCIAIRLRSQPVTAFALPSGLYCFTRLPFGLSISPQIWARAADTMLAEVKDVVSYYADDIVCHSHSFEEHLRDLDRLLAALVNSGVKVEVHKCTFFQKEVVWLGHRLTKDGLLPDPAGVAQVKRLTPPTTVPQLRSVIGSLNYFKDFMPGYDELLLQLNKLLRKGVRFTWGPDQDHAFQALKALLSSDQVLIKPDYSKDFYLQCDASDLAVSAILSQKDQEGRLRPIQYWGKKMSPAEANYSASEKEALAVYLAFKKFEKHLLLNTTHILTDAAVLKAFYGSREVASKRVTRWAVYVGQFHHWVTHIRGVDNDLADMWSRCVDYPIDQVSGMVAVIQGETTPEPIRWEDIKRYQEVEEPWKSLTGCITSGDWAEASPAVAKWRPVVMLSEQKLLCHQDKDRFGGFLRVIVPTKMIPLILYWNHDTMSAGHQGFDRTLRRIRQAYFWPTMAKDTELYVRSCLQCQLCKTAIPYLRCGYRPSKMEPDTPGETLCMDIAHLPRSTEGFTYILVIVDLFSRLVTTYPLRDMTANEIVKAVTTHCCQHGFPSTIFTDQAGAFKKALRDDCSQLLGIRHDTSVPWRHCSNTSKRYIQMVKAGLTYILPVGKFGFWNRYIRFVVYAINTSHCKSLGFSPFEAYYLRKPRVDPSLGDLQLHTQYKPQTEDWLEPIREAIRAKSGEMKGKYLTAANRPEGRPEGLLQVGDLVVIQRRDFPAGFPDKLMPRREGPLQVTTVRGSNIELTFLEGGGYRNRHLSEIAPFYNRPTHLAPFEVELGKEDPPVRPRGPGKGPPREHPKTVYGRIVDDMDEYLVVVSMDALSPGPTSETLQELQTKLNYYNPYGHRIRKRKAEDWETHFAKEPRQPGALIFSKAKTRHHPLTMCTIVTQVYQGNPSPDRVEEEYAHLPEGHRQLLSQDTHTNRANWLQEALTALSTQLAEEEEFRPPTGEVFIEGEMLWGPQVPEIEGGGEVDPEKMAAVETFTWLLKTMGLATTVIWRDGGPGEGGVALATTGWPFQELTQEEWPCPEVWEPEIPQLPSLVSGGDS